MGPAGFITSTSKDMIAWMQFMLREGTGLDNETLITSKALGEIFKPEIYTHFNVLKEDYRLDLFNKGSFYGKGMFIGSYRGKI